MAKGVFAVPTLFAASDDGLLSLDDHVGAWVPSWASDSTKAKVTLRELAFHASGMEDVDFDAGADGELSGWKKRYFDHPEERFRLALDSARFVFAPGSRFSYSGVGYYVLSYVLGKALQDSAASANIPSYVEAAVYGPLGVPPDAWSIGYGRSDTIEGIPLTHLGSGGELTARAAARTGQLFLDGGCWDGRRILPAGLVDTALGRHGVAPRAPDDAAAPGSGMGWWTNDHGTWPDAPRSAVAAIGSGHQVVWIDPGLHLVVVRLGAGLGAPGESFYEALGRHFVAPLYRALAAGPSREGDESVAAAPRDEGSESPSCAD
jgi:CubicO group peptidase (beta-lactamase class C family)